jgi:hypothetical protein
MSIDTFTAYALEKQTSQICGIAPSSNKNDQVVITVQHQGIYLYDVSGYIIPLRINNFILDRISKLLVIF